VELDKDLRFKDHFPKLAIMLMHGAGKPLIGLAMSDFIPSCDDEQSNFKNSVEQRLHQGDGAAGLITTRLRDSMGNLVKVVSYHVYFLGVSGEGRHLIGILEDGDAGPEAERATARTGQPAAVLRTSIAHELDADSVHRPAANRRTASSPSGRGSRGSGSSRRSGVRGDSILGQEDDEDIAAKVQARGPFPVVWMGKNSRANLGLGDGEACDLGEFLPNGGEWLEMWLGETADKASEGNYGFAFTERFGEMSLESRRGGARGSMKELASARFQWPPRVNGEIQDVVLTFRRTQVVSLPSWRGTVAGNIRLPLEGTAATASRRGHTMHV